MRDRTSKYAVQLFLSGKYRMTSSCWFCNEHGRPTYKNVLKYLDDYNRSLLPGGVNEQLGVESRAYRVEVYKNDGSRELVMGAGWHGTVEAK